MSLPELFINRPRPLEPAAVAQIAARFGVAGSQTPLASERDQNVLITSPSGSQYVLKIRNPADPMELTELETEVLLHLERAVPEIEVPRTVRAREGSYSIVWPTADGMRPVRLLTFVPGRPLAGLKSNRRLRFSVGATLARISVAMRAIRRRPPDRPMPWDLRQFGDLRSILEQSADRELLDRGAHLFRRWERSELGGSAEEPVNSVMTPQLLHNDFNPHNLISRESSPERVSGVIDFGDMTRGPPVFDLAVALAYWLCEPDGIDAVIDLLKGFHHVRRVSASELIHLPLLMEMRLVMTLLITRWRAERNPENQAYILRNEPAARRGLTVLSGLSERELCAQLERRLAEEQP